MKGSDHEVGGSVWSWRSPSGFVVSVVLVGGRVHLSPPQAEMQKWIRHNNSTFNPLSSSSCSSLHTCHILYKVSKKIKQNTEKSSPVQTIDFFHVKLSCFFFFLFSHTAKILIHSDKFLVNEASQHLPLWTGMLQQSLTQWFHSTQRAELKKIREH